MHKNLQLLQDSLAYRYDVNVTLKVTPIVRLCTSRSHLLLSALDMFWFGDAGGGLLNFSKPLGKLLGEQYTWY